MQSAPKPENEADRLKHLLDLSILDTIEEQAYDDLTYLAAHICETPIALISLIDSERQWFKSHYGLDARETPRDLAFCAHAILSDDVFIVEDSDSDSRFADNPLVTGNPLVKFYAGAPLIFKNNIRLGTLCVIDNSSRIIKSDQVKALQALARQVVSQFELRIKIRDLQKLDEAKDAFVSMVSHELRTPLTAINGALGLLKHETGKLPNATLHNLTDIAYRNTSNLMILVNDILDIAKMEAGSLALDIKKLDLVELVKNTVALNQHYFIQCHCRTHLEFSSEQLFVNGDSSRLRQVLNNLLSNAAKFSANDDTIEIKVERINNRACVSITNHGAGIPLEKHSMIFQKFSQISKNTDNKLPGTGLGLSICKQIIELHGGEIGFTSSPEISTTFYFSLLTS